MYRKEKQYDLLVYIGRFQPLHKGHEHVMNRAAGLADNILVLVGSAGKPRDIKNPWTFEEREHLIKTTAVANNQNVRWEIKPLYDHVYNEQRWIMQVQDLVDNTLHDLKCRGRIPENAQVGIIGHSKDESSYYLNCFPYAVVEVDKYSVVSDRSIDATTIRNLYLDSFPAFIEAVVAPATWKFLIKFWTTDECKQLRDEYKFIQEYKKQWASSPYPPTFSTVDSVVVASGHVLLIQRGALPGKGLWALPGGFLDPNETQLQGALRELREETRLKVPVEVLQGSIFADETFDDPNRSLRGRTVTRCFGFKLKDNMDLPKVKGSDDAAIARWFTLAEVARMQDVMYEDHYHILQKLISRL